jgi:hypothetical protein
VRLGHPAFFGLFVTDQNASDGASAKRARSCRERNPDYFTARQLAAGKPDQVPAALLQGGDVIGDFGATSADITAPCGLPPITGELLTLVPVLRITAT